MVEIGSKVSVLPEYDIPEIFRPNGPSTGVVEKVVGDTVIVVIDGAAVPYHPHELTPAKEGGE